MTDGSTDGSTDSSTDEGHRQDAERARELLLQAATHNVGSSVRNDLVAEAAVWAALYQARVIEQTGRNDAAAAALGAQAEALGGAVRRLADALSRRSGGGPSEGGPAR